MQTGHSNRAANQAPVALHLVAIAVAIVSGLAACDRGRVDAMDVFTDASMDADTGFVDRAPLPPAVCAPHDASYADAATGPITVVHLDRAAAAPLQLAVQACAGLRNRAASGSVYVDTGSPDADWLAELGLVPRTSVSADEFLASCLTDIHSCVRYDYARQQRLLPNVLTVASVLGAVPVDSSLSVSCTNMAFDAVTELAAFDTPALATQYVFDRYGARTTGLAMLNPGYDTEAADPANPALTRDMDGALVDYVFSQRLFALFLVNGCTEGNPERDLLSRIVNAGHWPTPLPVYGYNNSWNVAGGYLYEAQTLCLGSRNMGAVASQTNNLSFFSTRSPPIVDRGSVQQSAPEVITYDPTRTYVAFVVGDGDNINYMLHSRRDWFLQRIAACEAAGAACPTLSWTISPHLTHLAPDILRWYYDQSHRTGHDYFTLPPSGHLYAYPTSLAADSQDRFVSATEDDACALDISGVVHWDWSGTWRTAERSFLPKYARLGGPIRGIFPVNVPFVLEAFPWWPENRFFEVLAGADGGEVVLFRPREWRGIDSETDAFRFTPQRMADEIAGYPRGTVTWVYMTSDGGLTLENSFLTLAGLLPAHVQLVSTDAAAVLARASGQP